MYYATIHCDVGYCKEQNKRRISIVTTHIKTTILITSKATGSFSPDTQFTAY